MSSKAVEKFLETVAIRKEELTNAELETIRAQTPSDDSPAAERMMREILTGGKKETFYVDTGYEDYD